MNLAALIEFYEQLSPQSVERFPEFYNSDAWFKDPFNEVTGVAAIQHIFTHMFRQVGEPRFIVIDQVADERGAMLIWEFHYRVRSWGGGRPQGAIRQARARDRQAAWLDQPAVIAAPDYARFSRCIQ